MMTSLPNIHPGEILQEEFMEPLGISAYRLAKDLGVPQTRIAAILHGRRGISPDTAARLGRYFRTSPQFWLNLQTAYDLEELEKAKRAEIEAIQPRDDIAVAG
jgi:addiction module HigA family antidote